VVQETTGKLCANICMIINKLVENFIWKSKILLFGWFLRIKTSLEKLSDQEKDGIGGLCVESLMTTN
jgi:uncharacterized membrane protein